MKRHWNETIRVEPPPSLEHAFRRLEEYDEKDEKDFTKRLFHALLTEGPPDGRRNIINWICLPQIPSCGRLEFTELDSLETNRCDDKVLSQRARWLWDNLILPAKGSVISGSQTPSNATPSTPGATSDALNPAAEPERPGNATRETSFRNNLLMRDDCICKITGIEDVTPPSYRVLQPERRQSALEAAHIIHFHFMAKSSSQSSVPLSSSRQRSGSTSGSSRKSTISRSPVRSKNLVNRVAQSQPSLNILRQNRQNIRADRAWKTLQLYAGNESKLNELLQHPKENVKYAINSTYNGLLLDHDAHLFFDALKAYLWPHDDNPNSDSNTYIWHQNTAPGQYPPWTLKDVDGKVVQFDSKEEQLEQARKQHEEAPDKPQRKVPHDPPSRYLLWLHGTLAKVVHAVGNVENDDETWRDDYIADNGPGLLHINIDNMKHLRRWLNEVLPSSRVDQNSLEEDEEQESEWREGEYPRTLHVL